MLNYYTQIRPYENLANAVIKLAVLDIYNQNKHKESALKFLKSEWGRFLCPVEMDLILKKLSYKMKGSDDSVFATVKIQKACKSRYYKEFRRIKPK